MARAGRAKRYRLLTSFLTSEAALRWEGALPRAFSLASWSSRLCCGREKRPQGRWFPCPSHSPNEAALGLTASPMGPPKAGPGE